LFSNSQRHLNPSPTQLREPAPRNGWVRVFHRRDDAFDAGSNDGFGAGACAAGGAARFEGYVECRAARLCAGFSQCDDFGVVTVVVIVETLANDTPALYQYRADDRVGMRERDAAERLRLRARHVKIVCVANRRAS